MEINKRISYNSQISMIRAKKNAKNVSYSMSVERKNKKRLVHTYYHYSLVGERFFHRHQ